MFIVSSGKVKKALLTRNSNYCLCTIFQILHISISHFSETPQEKYDHVIFLQPMSRKKCHKNFENRFTNKIIVHKNLEVLNRQFACDRIQKGATKAVMQT